MKVIGRDNQVKNGFLHFPAFLQTLLGELTDEAIAKAIPGFLCGLPGDKRI